MKIYVRQNQTLFDVAIRETGDVTGAYALAILNGISVTDELKAGDVLELPAVINPGVVNYYKTQNIHPATADNEFNRTFDPTFDPTFK